jgi:hypothetical protein
MVTQKQQGCGCRGCLATGCIVLLLLLVIGGAGGFLALRSGAVNQDVLLGLLQGSTLQSRRSSSRWSVAALLPSRWTISEMTAFR